MEKKFQPIKWWIEDPTMVNENHLEIVVKYTTNGRGEEKKKVFVYHIDDFFPELVEIAQAKSLDSVKLVHTHKVKMIATENVLKSHLREKASEAKNISEVERFFLNNCDRLLLEHVREYTLLKFAEIPVSRHDPAKRKIIELALQREAEESA